MKARRGTTGRFAAIIVAAGSGTRMGGVDKLFAPLAGKPVLALTLRAFQQCAAVSRIVLVMPAVEIERGRALLREGGFSKVAAVCAGGARRQDSVRLGLETLGPCEWVAVHDGARPLVTPELIERALAAAEETGAAAPAVALADTVKEIGPGGLVVRTLDRARLRAVQTPQVFRYDLLVRAHREITADVTDDAAMIEALKLPVQLFEGSRRNIKITTPEDLALAEALLKTQDTRPPNVILHIARREDWEQARAKGVYRGDTLDSDGFIHCCTEAQLAYVLQTYFAGQKGLVALHIDPDKVQAAVRWEESGPGSPYPHIYGPLNLDAIVQVQELSRL